MMRKNNHLGKAPISRSEFRLWAADQRGRFERVDGEVVAMSPERLIHARVKAAVWRALSDALLTSQITTCEAFPDGVTVEIDEHTDYEPDVVINCGEAPDDAVAAPNPVVVVEVLSPSTRATDTGGKLAGYFEVPSISHYLIIHPTKRQVVHHRRLPAGLIATTINTHGMIILSPPGITVSLESFYE